MMLFVLLSPADRQIPDFSGESRHQKSSYGEVLPGNILLLTGENADQGQCLFRRGVLSSLDPLRTLS